MLPSISGCSFQCHVKLIFPALSTGITRIYPRAECAIVFAAVEMQLLTSCVPRACVTAVMKVIHKQEKEEKVLLI